MTKDKLAVGVDFGGTKMLAVLADEQGNIHGEHRLPTPYTEPELIDHLVQLVEILEEAAGVKVFGLGVGAAGLVSKKGVLNYGPNVGGVENVDLASGLSKRRPDLKLVIENDATCACLSESRVGAGKGYTEMVMITLGTGIGSALICNDKLIRGANGFAGEYGHMTIDVGGIECVCGKAGCWEAYASGRAIGEMGREAAAAGEAHEVLLLAGAIQDIRGEHVTQAARTGDNQALAIINEFAKWVAVGIANVVAVTDPEVVVIGGGMAEDADLFLARAQQHLDEIVYGSGNRPVVPLLPATLGERAGAMGAAMITFIE